jgi:hypothetical protein
MSRGDEIEEGAPKPRWRDDSDEPDDRGRSVRIDKPGRSGAVTAVGIVAIILGCLSLIGGGCIGCIGAGLPFLQEFANQNKNDPNMAKAAQDLSRIPAWFVIAEAVVAAIRGVGLLVGGILVLRRSNAGRMLTLGMAVFGLVAVCADVGGGLALGILEPSGMVGSAIGTLFTIGFAVFAFIVLLKNGNEFRSVPRGDA